MKCLEWDGDCGCGNITGLWRGMDTGDKVCFFVPAIANLNFDTTDKCIDAQVITATFSCQVFHVSLGLASPMLVVGSDFLNRAGMGETPLAMGSGMVHPLGPQPTPQPALNPLAACTSPVDYDYHLRTSTLSISSGLHWAVGQPSSRPALLKVSNTDGIPPSRRSRARVQFGPPARPGTKRAGGVVTSPAGQRNCLIIMSAAHGCPELRYVCMYVCTSVHTYVDYI